jgi:hypothetical protein
MQLPHSLGLIVDVSAEVQQQSGHVQVISEGGNIQRSGVVPATAGQTKNPIK